MADPHAHSHHHAHPGLEVTVDRKGPCVASVRFQVSPQEFQRTIDQGLRNVSKRTRMKGFRPGKTPRQIVEKTFGDQVRREAIEHFVNHAFDDAVREHDLRPAMTPRVDLSALEPGEDGSLEHEFEVLLRPDVELGEYKGLSVDSRPIDVTDEEVDGALAELRQRHSHPEPAGAEGLPEDGMAVCRVEFLAAGSQEVLLEREGARVGPKGPPTGVDADVFEKAMVGVVEGDMREFDVDFSDAFPVERARGTRGRCRLTAKEVYAIVPPDEGELNQAFGVEDAGALRQEVAKRIREAKDDQERQRVEGVLLERLLETHPMELPERLIEDQAEAKIAELRRNLEEQGIDPAELDERLEQERKGAREATSRAMRAIYLMEEIAKAEDMQVTQADLLAELRSIAERNQADFDEVRKYYQEEGLIRQLALELLERKVRSFLRESADIRVTAAAG